MTRRETDGTPSDPSVSTFGDASLPDGRIAQDERRERAGDAPATAPSPIHHPRDPDVHPVGDRFSLMLWSARPDGRVELFDPGWRAFTGSSSSSAEVGGWGAMVHPDDRQRVQTRWRESLEGGTPFEAEFRLRHRGGCFRWVAARGLAQKDAGGAIVRWLGSCADIQAAIEARAELERRLDARLRETEGRLAIEIRRREAAQSALLQSQKLEALGQLTSSVAHDFNNVLALVSSTFSIIEQRAQDSRIKDLAGRGIDTAHRGGAIVKQLLAFARKKTPVATTMSLSGLLAEAEPLLRRSAGPRVGFTVACETDTPAVRVDSSQFVSALINLCANARDAMERGGALAVRARRCPPDEVGRPPELAGRCAAAVTVVDNGSGMAPNVLQRVTEPFFTTKDSSKGTGLGLAMVCSFVQQCGGALRIESRVGAGTSITMFLPEAETGAEAARAPPQNARTALIRSDRAATVLLVDADEGLRAAMAAHLSGHGCHLVQVADSRAAMTALLRSSGIDLVIVDAGQGADLVANIRRRHPVLPVLIVADDVTGSQFRGEAVIAKPFETGVLDRHLRDLLARPQEAGRPAESGRGILESRIRSAELKRLLRSWHATRPANGIPGVSEIQAISDGAARRLAVIDVDMGRVPITFRLAQVGDDLLDLADVPLAGLDLKVVGDDALGFHEAAYRRCARSGKPTYEFADFELGDDDQVLFERLLLPFADDGVNVAKLVAAIVLSEVPAEPRRRGGGPP